jgi:predicted transposase YdaD
VAKKQTSHDQKFKELIATFFIEFLELFLPDLAKAIEPDSVTFREQEYFIDLVEGEKKVIDLLAEVKLAGEDATVLIHIEPQSTHRLVFPQRMFFYFSRLHQKHLKRIYPIAIFSYDQPDAAATSQYKVEFPNLKVLEFNFTAIQLNRLNWRDFIECLRLLVTLKLDPAKIELIAQFVDTYLRLNAKEEKRFQAEIDTMNVAQREEIMQVTTSWEEKGIKKGIKKGVAKERQKIALKMLGKNLPLETIAEVTGLTIDQLHALQASQ